MITGLITALGFNPGESLIPADRTNRKGAFEDKRLFDLVVGQKHDKKAIERYLADITSSSRVVKAPSLACHLPLTFPDGTRFIWAHRPMPDVLHSAVRAYGGQVEDYQDDLGSRYDRIASFLTHRAYLQIEYDRARRDPEGTARRVALWLKVPNSDQACGFIEPPGNLAVTPMS
ncbi:MAG: sulfotransferase [Planctomycetota bacterium]